APLTDDFIAQMLSLEIKTANAMELHDILFRQYKIQVPIMQLGNRSFLRFSIQGFNTRQDLDKLYDAVKDLISKGLIIT
ncbi:MAG: aminotransferase class V-fold PLP-dependent enzyme, partial [Chitinophagaceae bacterium]|nr:aminotransferase class V-fold PLP-dependent enzyme [Chitinophagaceae bacterium]